jgi:hypothetical protein
MSEENEIPNTAPIKDPNEIREVSILKRNLKLLKRLALGKKTPPLFLKIVCYIFLAWDILMILFFSLSGIFKSVLGLMQSETASGPEITSKYLFTYALLHGVSLLGVLFAWRKKITGFYIFAIANILMPFWYFFITKDFQFETKAFIFSLISIGLFAANWRVYTVNVNKRAAAKAIKAVAQENAGSEE